MSLLETLNNLPSWQISLLVIGLLLQGAVVAVFPEEIVLIVLGVLWSQGKIGFVQALVSAQVGLLPANLVAVWIGSKLSGRLPVKKRKIHEAVSRLHELGSWLVVITRFTPIVRGPVYYAAGLCGFSLRRFFLADFGASLVQIPALLVLGRAIGMNTDSIEDAYRIIGLIAGGAFAIFLSWFLLREIRKMALNQI